MTSATQQPFIGPLVSVHVGNALVLLDLKSSSAKRTENYPIHEAYSGFSFEKREPTHVRHVWRSNQRVRGSVSFSLDYAAVTRLEETCQDEKQFWLVVAVWTRMSLWSRIHFNFTRVSEVDRRDMS